MRPHVLVAALAALVPLAALGGGVVGVDAGAQPLGDYAVEQGDNCTEIEPFRNGSASVEEFYGYADDGEANNSSGVVAYSANMPSDVEERNDRNSSLLLYESPRTLALVVIHGAPKGEAGGAASFAFSGLPEDGEWVVRDDPENLSPDRWNRTSGNRVVDWSWRDRYTDGGAFAGLDGEFEVTIDPAFDEQAALEPLTPGEVNEWRVLSRSDGGYERVTLDMDERVTVRTGSC